MKIKSLIKSAMIASAALCVFANTYTYAATMSAARYFELGKEYEEKGDYASACECFEKCIPYAQSEGEQDTLRKAAERVQQYKTVFELYTLSGSAKSFFGMKNEPDGLLYGENYEKSKSAESMMIGYMDYKGMSVGYVDDYLRAAQNGKKSLVLALNVKDQEEMNRLSNDESYMNNIAKKLNSYKNVPVYLRIGAEMNIWDDRPDPEGYKSAFITIAEYFRKKAPHAAIMWSIAQNSAWGTDYRDYYPGDSHVDWIGISAYSKKYFNGKKTDNTDDQIYFNVGDYADPELAIADIVDTLGKRRPIMISEGGAAYRTDGYVNESHDEWGAVHLRKLLSYVPMLYTQVKGINYFNNEVKGEINHFSLSNCAKLQNSFDELTRKDWFIHNRSDNSSKGFVRVNNTINAANGTLEVYAYNHVFQDEEPSVDYYIDGNHCKTCATIPYELSYDISGLENGDHTFTAVLNLSNGKKLTKEYTLDISGNKVRFGHFKDISALNTTQQKILEKMFDRGVITGYDDGTIQPYGSVTRAEFAALLCRAMSYNSSAGCTFDDAKSHWASSFIQACVNKGAINGIGNNLFAPDDNVKFEQAVKIVTASSGLTQGYDLDSMGGYPAAYIKIGRSYDLYNNMENPVTGDDMTRIDAMVLINNIMSSDTGPIPTVRPTPSPTPRPTPTPTPAPVKKTLYRYRDKETTMNSSSSMPGWTRVDENTTYGSWSDYQDNYIGANDTTEVRTRTVRTETKHYKTQYWYGGYFWTLDGRYQSSARPKSGVDNTFRDTGWLDYELEFSQDFGGGYIMYRNPNDGLYYFRNPNDGNYQGPTREVYDYSTYEDKTQYSSRSKQTTYTYERWGDWSSWSERSVSGSSTRQVETKTVVE